MDLTMAFFEISKLIKCFSNVLVVIKTYSLSY